MKRALALKSFMLFTLALKTPTAFDWPSLPLNHCICWPPASASLPGLSAPKYLLMMPNRRGKFAPRPPSPSLLFL